MRELNISKNPSQRPQCVLQVLHESKSFNDVQVTKDLTCIEYGVATISRLLKIIGLFSRI